MKEKMREGEVCVTPTLKKIKNIKNGEAKECVAEGRVRWERYKRVEM